MGDSRPRDLTPDERASLENPAARDTGTAPLRIPPGTDVAIELLNPLAVQQAAAATAAPTAGPEETPVPEAKLPPPRPRRKS